MSTNSTSDTPLRQRDIIRLQHDELMTALTRQPAEPWVTVEITDAAKGEIRVETKISAPLGCDTEALEAHAADVKRIAVETHTSNGARKGPES